DVNQRKMYGKLPEQKNPIFQLAYGPDGQRLATGDRDGNVRAWDERTGAVLHDVWHNGEVTRLLFSPDGQWLAVAIDNNVSLSYLLGGRQQTLKLQGHTDKINHLVFSQDGQRLATGSEDGTVKV